MIVTVIAVRMVKVAIHEVIDVVSMRHGLMTTSGSMDMVGIVTSARVGRSAGIWVRVAHFHDVLFNFAVLANVMQVPVVQVVGVVAMLNSCVLTVRPVVVIVILVTIAHRLSPHLDGFPSRA